MEFYEALVERQKVKIVVSVDYGKEEGRETRRLVERKLEGSRFE